MKRKTKYRSVPLNIFVVLLCLSVFAGSLWLFFNDLNSSSSRTDKDAIATITFKYKIAQRKYNDRVVWERVRQDSPLYDGDTIRTADLAQATIHFGEGAKIDINENTMVQIGVSEDGRLKVSVGNGQVEVDATNSKTSIALDMGGSMLVNLEKGSKVSAELKENLDGIGIQIKEGNATVENKNNPAVVSTLAAGEAVNVSATGTITKRPIIITSVSDNQRVLIFENEKTKTIPLEWRTSEKVFEKMIVQTSTKKDFSEIKDSYAVTNENKVEITPSAGLLYWKVFIENDEENYAQGKLNFEVVSEVVPTSPQAGEVFTYYKQTPEINLSWAGNNYANKYMVEVSKSKNLSNPYFKTEVASQNIVLLNLGEGKYYWRVTPYYETNGIGYHGGTEIKSFTVTKQKELNPPKLSFPPNKKKFTYKEKSFDVDFAWKGENVKSQYTIQISRDENFSNIILNEQTQNRSLHKSLSAVDFTDGEYYWKVTQSSKVSDTETEKLDSNVRKFTVAKFEPNKKAIEAVVIPKMQILPEPILKTPTANQIIDGAYLKKNRSILFSWKSVDKAANYDFVLSQKMPDGTLKKIYESTKQKSTKLKLKDLTILDVGDFQWEVYANGNDSKDTIYTRSKAATNDFSINFGLPNKVKTIKPGEMYGE